MTAEDVGATLAAFALSFSAVLQENPGAGANQILQALVREMAVMADDMVKRGGITPASKALQLTAGYLNLSDPDQPTTSKR
jgi:hypothetical protein